MSDKASERLRLQASIITGCAVAIVALSVMAGVYVTYRTGDTIYSAGRSSATREAGGVIVIEGAANAALCAPAHKWAYHDNASPACKDNSS